MALTIKKIPVFEYSPRLIKQSIVGNGNASKEQVSGMLQSMYPGVSHKYLDASDALAALFIMQTSGIPSRNTVPAEKTKI